MPHAEITIHGEDGPGVVAPASFEGLRLSMTVVSDWQVYLGTGRGPRQDILGARVKDGTLVPTDAELPCFRSPRIEKPEVTSPTG